LGCEIPFFQRGAGCLADFIVSGEGAEFDGVCLEMVDIEGDFLGKALNRGEL
jgi:hypothetical protein